MSDGPNPDVTTGGDEELPVDRHGHVTTERARDRKGMIAYMAKNGVAANLLALFMLISGYISYVTIVQEVFPESNLETVSVTVVYPGATPEEVEESIIQKIEEAVETVEDVDKIKAVAAEGLARVMVELENGTDVDRALNDIKSEVDQIQTFPLEAEEPAVAQVTNRQSAMRIALFGDVPERSLKEMAYQLEDGLSGLDAISFVETTAVRDYRIHIDVPQDRLESLGLSLTDVARIVGQSSLDSPAGSVDTSSEEVRVRTVGQNYGQRDFEDIVLVPSSDGTTLRVGDVAKVNDGFEDSDLVTRFNGVPVAFVDVYRTSDERVLDVAGAAKTYLHDKFAPRLPPGVHYAIWDDSSDLFADRLGLLLKNAAIGFFLVVLALALFLDLRLAMWSTVGIAVTFIGALFIVQLFGSSINVFSTFGFILALGLVVDNAVVVGENIYAERERGRSAIGASIAGAQRVRIPVIFAVATTVAAFCPIFAVTGLPGKLFDDVPLVVIAVLVLSLIEALLILPYHLSTLPPPGTPAKYRITRAIERVQKGFDKRFRAFVEGPLDRGLRFAIAMPYLVLAAGAALLLVMAAMLPGGLIKFSFFPPVEGDNITAKLEMPAGTTIERTADITKRLEAAGDRTVARFAEDRDPDFLRDIYTSVGQFYYDGSPFGREDRLAPNLSSVVYALVPPDERDFTAAEFEAVWREELGPVPEARSLQISSDVVSLGEPVNVKLSHPDDDALEAASNRLIPALSGIAGVFDIESDQDVGMREIELRLKPSARTLGITLQDLAGQVRAAFFGAEAVRVQRGREDVRVYVRLPEEERDSIADVEQYRIRVPGGQVPLSTLADVSFGVAPSVIRREDGRRVTTVTADVDEDTITGLEVTSLLQQEILPAIAADYPGLQYSFGGAQEELQESFSSLGIAFLVALLAIYALLAIPFKSYLQPLVIMAAIPFGMIGALFAHLILGISLGILSMFGIIGMSGVIVNGSLVMIDFMNENLADGMEWEEALIDAAKSRFRPIILTAITTFVGIAPVTFETSVQAKFLIAMAASLGFGVLFGTILLQLMIPALAILQMRAVDRVRGWFKRPAGSAAPAGAVVLDS